MDKYLIVEATADPKDGAAYTANDVVGGLLTFSLDGAVVNGGILNSAYFVDDDNEGAELDLYLFSAAPTAIADDAAFAPSAADLQKMFAVINVETTDYLTVNSLKYAYKKDINQIIKSDGGQKIYGYLVAVGTPTYAAAKTILIRLSIVSER